MPLLGRERGTRVFRELDEHPDDETVPGVPVLRLDGGLFFATAEALEERIRGLADGGAAAIVLDCKGVNFVDSQGAEKLAEIHELLDLSGRRLRLAHVKPQVLAVLRADGVIDRLGADHIHGNVAQALEAERSAERDRLA